MTKRVKYIPYITDLRLLLAAVDDNLLTLLELSSFLLTLSALYSCWLTLLTVVDSCLWTMQYLAHLLVVGLSSRTVGMVGRMTGDNTPGLVRDGT